MQIITLLLNIKHESHYIKFICRLTSFIFLYNRSLFLSRKPRKSPKKGVSQLKIKKSLDLWVTEADIGVSFTHNTVGDLPGIMQETEISPLQSLTCHFVSQFVPAVKEVKRDRGMKSERLYRAVLILRLYRLTVGSLARHQPAQQWGMEFSVEDKPSIT